MVRAELLRTLKHERYGEMADAEEYGRLVVARELFVVCAEVFGTNDAAEVGREIEGMASLRFGKKLRDCDREELRSLLLHARETKQRMNDFPVNRPFDEPQVDERTASESEWDNEVLHST